jgi:hypothetical protein
VTDEVIDRVLFELMDRRLLNDVDDSLHNEIAVALINAVLGDATCKHNWRDVESTSENTIKCTLCNVYGERQKDGAVYWPAT